MSLSPAEIIELLGPTTSDLSPRIGSIEKVWQDANHKIEGRFLYVRFRDSLPTIEELITIAHGRMVNFCLPRDRIMEAQAKMQENPECMDCWVDLVTEARDLFIKTYKDTGSRSGELGEVLLYMLIEWLLNAPIVACKMYLKTSLQMPVHGADGVHMGAAGDHLIMYWGESKLHKNFASALVDIADSISKITENTNQYDNEVRLIKSNLNVDRLNAEAKIALKNYFDPYKAESNKIINCYACLAGFDSKIYQKVATLAAESCEEEFCKIYEKRIDNICENITKKVLEYKLQHFRFSYFLLPFPSVDDAREKFQTRLWGRP